MNVIDNSEFHDLLEYPWEKTFILLRSNQLSPKIYFKIVSNINFTDMDPNFKFVSENLKHIADLTFIDPFRLSSLITFVKRLKDIEGDLVECGTCKGGSGILMALALKFFNINKHVHLFDSFSGLPKTSKEIDKGYAEGMFNSDYQTLNNKITQMGLQNSITLHKGFFHDSLPKFVKNFDKKISLLHIDCDIYKSTKDCFHYLFPLMPKGSGVILDEFNDGGRGEKKATLESLFYEKQDIIIGPAPQAFFFKNKKIAVTDSSYSDAGFNYHFDELFKNKIYIKWLNEKTDGLYISQVKNFLKNNP